MGPIGPREIHIKTNSTTQQLPNSQIIHVVKIFVLVGVLHYKPKAFTILIEMLNFGLYSQNIFIPIYTLHHVKCTRYMYLYWNGISPRSPTLPPRTTKGSKTLRVPMLEQFK